jgi:hypothetical protein
MVLVVFVPLALTLLSVKQPRPAMEIRPWPAENPSPYGYTWSLLLFIIPDLVLGWWILAMHRGRREKVAFWLTVGVLVPLWCLLDIFLGLTFFKFPNLGASVGTFWGYSFGEGWQKAIPIEEIGFYAFGFIAMLLVYIWGDEYWFASYKKASAMDVDPAARLFRPHLTSALVGLGLFGAAWAYKRFGPHPYNEGIPGYFLFMLLACILPSLMCYRLVRDSINWRAFSFGFLYILFVSVFWEAAVGVPYQWWDYHRSQMMGIFIGAFTGLPVEAVILWVFSSWTTVIVYRTVHLLLSRRALPLARAGNPSTSLGETQAVSH